MYNMTNGLMEICMRMVLEENAECKNLCALVTVKFHSVSLGDSKFEH
jgi:hypothetical protein